MGIYSNWEEESYREEALRDERLALADLFRECAKGDPCGACPRCATDEQGHVGA